jgi:rod shape-determining protein MreD
MWPYLFLIPAVYLAAVLDTSLGSALDIGPAAPNMLAVIAIVWSLAIAPARGYLATGAVGFASDVISPGHLGADMACYAIVGYIVSRLRARLGGRRPLVSALWAFPAAAIMVLGPAMVRRALGEFDIHWITLVARGLLSGAYTAVLTLPVVCAAVWISRVRRQRLWM